MLLQDGVEMFTYLGKIYPVFHYMDKDATLYFTLFCFSKSRLKISVDLHSSY